MNNLFLGYLRFGLSFWLYFGLAACGLGQTGDKPFLRLESPDDMYIVQLKGSGDRPVVGTNIVKLEVLKNGREYVQPTLFHSADSMDLSVNLGYSRHRWVQNNVLQFHRTSNRKNIDKTIGLTTTNKSGENIAFVKIFCSDKILILDIAAGATLHLECSPPLGSFVDFFVEGRFADGREFKQGTSFPWQESESESYVIEISQNAVTIITDVPK